MNTNKNAGKRSKPSPVDEGSEEEDTKVQTTGAKGSKKSKPDDSTEDMASLKAQIKMLLARQAERDQKDAEEAKKKEEAEAAAAMHKKVVAERTALYGGDRCMPVFEGPAADVLKELADVIKACGFVLRLNDGYFFYYSVGGWKVASGAFGISVDCYGISAFKCAPGNDLKHKICSFNWVKKANEDRLKPAADKREILDELSPDLTLRIYAAFNTELKLLTGGFSKSS